MVLDGVNWRESIARHKAAPQEALIRKTLAQYQALGYTYLRDGGDRWGAGALAAKLAPEYGIRYRTPCFPIYKTGHYGSFIGRGFSTPAEYRALVRAAKAAGAHFIKIMISGLMDFEHYGVLTDEPLAPGEIADMIAGAHDEGFSVMAHANGDSAAHANYEDVCTGITGFREAVLITWDTGKTSLEALLFAFFAVVDVELPNRQGADIGTQYQTGIYWTTPEQARVVQAVAAMEAAAVPVFAVELKPLENFFPAEAYHQRYLERNPRGYCHISPARQGAVASYPFRREDYTRPARQLLAERM